MGEYGRSVVRAVLLCPGQGAQRVGMGRDLAERFSIAKETFDAVDDATGAGVSSLMWEGPESDLTLTHNAQPAILAHSLAVWAVIRDAVDPVAAAGHSLGEYSAYAAAGALGVADAARLVRRRGELMLEAGAARAGTMSAVLGLASESVVAACERASAEGEVVVAANVNAPDQTVISGDPGAVAQAGETCRLEGAKRVLPLKVSGAFHSPLMAPAEAGFRTALECVGFGEPNFPVVANASGKPVRDSATARRLLGAQLTSPVRWVECMRAAADVGGREVQFVEIGPGTVLSGLVRRILDRPNVVCLGTADEVARFVDGVE